MNKITRFIGEYSFLSNFYDSSIIIDGKLFKTVEHAYQAHKTLDSEDFEKIRKSKTPSEAKKIGRTVSLREDWDSVKVSLMKVFLQKKFENPFLADLLVSTQDALLIEENFWNDKFWGVCRGSGKNMLGKLLMEVRENIKHQQQKENELFQGSD
jgi:ribA/ribD-fused uncharacterized protein